MCEITGFRRKDLCGPLYGRAKTGFVLHARGIEHHSNGVDNVLSYINLVLATGKIGAPGRGYATFTGQGNGQGGREHGQKSDQLPGQRSINNPEHRKHMAEFWGIAEDELPQAGVSVVEMFQKMREGEIRGLISVCNNVMVSLPDTNKVRESLEGLDFYVCIDFFMSEAARYADVVLPGTAWSEDEGVTTNGEGRVLKINKATEPPGEAKPDWWIVQQLAKRLGREKFFPYTHSREMFNELREASRGGTADYGGISWERIERENGVFWPCPSDDHPGTPRMFEDRFYHPDGKARFHAVEYKGADEKPDDEYPLILTSGRVVFQYLSGNQTRGSSSSSISVRSRTLRSSETAKKLEIADGERKVVPDASRGLPGLVVADHPTGHDLRTLSLGRGACRESTDEPGPGSNVKDTGIQGMCGADRKGRFAATADTRTGEAGHIAQRGAARKVNYARNNVHRPSAMHRLPIMRCCLPRMLDPQGLFDDLRRLH